MMRSACKQAHAINITGIFANTKAHGVGAGLQKLQTLEVHGNSQVGEDTPGLLNKVLEGLTSLHLRAWNMDCSDVASPTLRCLTVISFDNPGCLLGADSVMQRSRYSAASCQ